MRRSGRGPRHADQATGMDDPDAPADEEQAVPQRLQGRLRGGSSWAPPSSRKDDLPGGAEWLGIEPLGRPPSEGMRTRWTRLIRPPSQPAALATPSIRRGMGRGHLRISRAPRAMASGVVPQQERGLRILQSDAPTS
jgi:hypothetical protein